MPEFSFNFKRRLKASTLIEVIIAMIIIMTVFGIAMHIFFNLESYNGNRQRIRALLLMQSVYNETISEHTYDDNEIELGQLVVEKTVSEQNESGTLLLLEMAVRDKKSGLLILQQERMIHLPIYDAAE